MISSAERWRQLVAVVVLAASALVGGVLLAQRLAGGAWSLAFALVVLGLVATATAGVVLLLARQNRRAQAEIGALVDRLRAETPSADHGEERPDAVLTALIESHRRELEALEERASLAGALLNATPNGVLVTDEEGRILVVGAAFRKMVKVRDNAVGRLPIEVVSLAEVHDAVVAALLGEPVTEVSCVSGDLDLTVRGIPIDGDRVMVIAQDVSRYRAAERARTDFVANVSHELRTPIASILGYAETLLLDQEGPTPRDRRLVEVIQRNGVRLRNIFEDLLQLHRIEVRRGALPVAPHRLRPILEGAVVSAADVAARREQGFSLECPEDLMAMCNAEALSAIVANLSSNATNYTPDRGTVAVRALLDGGAVRVEVRDDGIGIERAQLERIFERFYRVDDGRSRATGGTGLGLAIVKHLARACGARVTVESQKGLGSTFAVHLDAVGSGGAEASLAGRTPAPGRPAGSGRDSPGEG